MNNRPTNDDEVEHNCVATAAARTTKRPESREEKSGNRTHTIVGDCAATALATF